MSSFAEKSRRILTDLLAGSLSSLLVVAYAISFGALIFSFDQGAFLSQGMSVTLISSAVVGLVAAIFSSLPIIVAGPDSLATALIAITASGIAADVHTIGGQPVEVIATVLFALASSAVIAGMIFYILGHLRQGLLMQYLPYPVVGGFLAGSGYIIIIGALRLLIGTELNLTNLLAIPHKFPLSVLLATLICLALLIIPRWWKHYLLIPLTIIVGIALTYLAIFILGIDFETARQDRVIFQPLQVETAVPLPMINFSDVNWRVILDHAGELIVAMGVSLLTILMNTTGIEVMLKKDLDHDRELKVAGISNILSGLAGGIFGYQFFNRTNINFLAGATGRLSGIFSSLLCLGTLLVFPGVVAYFPRPVLAGLLAYVGIALMHAWVIKTYRQLNAYEYGLIILILTVIIFKGFMLGVLAGITGACVLFAFHYGRISAVKHEFSGTQNFSRCIRSADNLEILKVHSNQIFGVCLRGYIFFGSAHEIFVKCREKIDKGTKFNVLDFRQVLGLEASGGRVLLRLLDICKDRKIALILTAVKPQIRQQLESQGVSFAHILAFDDLAEGIQYVEESLLDHHESRSSESNISIEKQLAFHFSDNCHRHLLEYLKKSLVNKGEIIFKKGEPGDHLFFLCQGRVNVLGTLNEENAAKLNVFSDGTIFGETAVLSGKPRNAYVVADEDCVLYRLTIEDINRMGKENSATLLELQNYLLVTLASRLSSMSQTIEILI